MVTEQQLQKHLLKVKNSIAISAEKVNRDPASICLVAVSKNHKVDKIKYFHKQGIEIFGENRVQELREKYKKTTEFNLKWHFVGHLQRNKVKYLLRMKNCLMIESVDSLRLAREINKRAAKNDRTMPVLIEVNVSGQESKFGLNPTNTLEFFQKAASFDNLDIRGLMTLAPYSEDPEESRPFFRKLVEIKQNLDREGYSIEELSMGMSNDYTIAIEEGATIVRIGTALFGSRY